MSAAERAYRFVLRVYPRRFRAQFGREMVQQFNDQHRDARAGRLWFWAAMLLDVARSAPAQRLDDWRVRARGNFPFEEGIMRTMAILAILVGVMEVVNSAAEAVVGGMILHSGFSLVAGAAAAAAGGLLVASAIALLRETAGAAALAQGSSIACLAVFGLVAALHPLFSVIATLLGVGFPIAMLLYLRMAPRQGPSAPSAA